jgi:hypothetical protein
VAPEGAAGQRPALDVRVYLLARQCRADVLDGVADDPGEEVGTFLLNWNQSCIDICYLLSVSNQPATGIRLNTDFGLVYGRYMPCI